MLIKLINLQKHYPQSLVQKCLWLNTFPFKWIVCKPVDINTIQNEFNILQQLRVIQFIPSLCSISTNKQLCYFYIKASPLHTQYTNLLSKNLLHRLAIFRKLLSIVKQVHQHGVLHNDISPGNILLDKFHQPYLIDFGNACNLSQPTQHIMAKPHYGSPEQCSNMALTASSDVYQLGCILFELVTGQQYQDEQNTVSVDLMDPCIDKLLRPIFKKLLAENSNNRYSSVTECINDIDTYINRHLV